MTQYELNYKCENGSKVEDVTEKMPELEGSDKQVVWAMQIRSKFLKTLDLIIYKYKNFVEREKRRKSANADDLEKYFKDDELSISKCRMYVTSQKQAKFFINNRFYLNSCESATRQLDTYVALKNFGKCIFEYAKLYDEENDTEAKAAAQEEIEKRVEVHPEEVKSDTIITLKSSGNYVYLMSDYSSRLVDVIHNLDLLMSWENGCWQFRVHEFCGTHQSVIAEIGNKLLEKGFIVVFPDKATADMAVSGEFEHYVINTVFVCADNNKMLSIRYNRNDNTTKNMLCSIRKSRRRSKDRVVIPVSSYQELEELAEENVFAWSALAKKAIEDYKQSILIASPAHTVRKEGNKPGRKDVDLSDLNDD